MKSYTALYQLNMIEKNILNICTINTRVIQSAINSHKVLINIYLTEDHIFNYPDLKLFGKKKKIYMNLLQVLSWS